jgi:hypothetical protein
MRIKKVTIEFPEIKIKKADIPKFRGFISNRYPNYELIHNHLREGGFRYSYPVIQFKTINKRPVIVGINEGIDILKHVFMEIEDIRINYSRRRINEKSISICEDKFGEAEEFLDYKFIFPWMALNQNNYDEYIKLNKFDQQSFLRHILRENLKTISKGFGYEIKNIDGIKVDGIFIKKEIKFKNMTMLCFAGNFMTNFYLPDYLGIGKQVARGFGTVGKRN